MKKITILFMMLAFWSAGMKAQCINTVPYPTETIVSVNSGDPQQINSCIYTGNFSTVSNLTVGNDYIFSLSSNGTSVTKYITVTDVNNEVLANGPSPLTVSGIPNTSARVHYAEDEACATLEWCLEAYVTAVLTCPFPTNIQISGVSQTNASFNWIPGGTETAWEVMVLPKGTPAPESSNSGISVVDNPQYAVSDLEAGNRYQFYVKADCGSEFSPWRGPYDFNAACSPVAEFSENFDGITDNELPACWTALKVDAATDAYIGIDGLSNSAPNAVQLANGNSASAANILLISPDLSTVGTGDHRLKFYTRGYGNVTIEVGTINTTTSDGTFNLIETINANANYTEHTVNFMDYAGTDTHIAFRHANTSTYNPVFVDDIRWELAPLCPDLGHIEMTAIAQTAATVAWEPGDSETQWDVVYSDTLNDPALLTPVSPAPTSPEATITGLQPNTAYKVWVRSVCGGADGNGAWMNPVTFTTACDAVSILNEGFESTAFGALPECWSAIVAGNGMFNSRVQVVTNNASGGSNAVSLSDNDGISDSKIILVSPSLNTVATGTHRVKFYAKSNVPTSMIVGTLDSAATGGNFNDYQTINLTPSYAEFVVDFSDYAGTDNYIGFRHVSGQYVSIYLDDIRWEQTPLCADVSSITVNATADAAAVNWDANAGETQWDVVYGTADVTDPNVLTPISPAPAGNSETVLSGLMPNTPYKVWVRSVCGGALGNGAWIGPVSFRTACLPVGNFSEGFEGAPIDGLPDCWSAVLAGPTLGQYAAVRTVNHDMAFGSNAIEIHANSSAPTDWVMLVSPYLNNLGAGTHRLKFYALSYNNDTPFEIGTMNGNNSQATYTAFQTLTLGNNGYNEYVIDFTNYSGSDSYIAFRNIAGNYNSTFIDNVRWEVLPSCPDVTSLDINGTNADGATITWEGNGESNWQVTYGGVSVSDPSTLTPSGLITETSYQISGLEDNTFYNVWVRSVCGGPDGFGAWIGPVTFRTDCLSTSAPYTEDFESVSLPNLPECFTAQTISGNGWDTTWGDSGYGFDGYVIRYQGNSAYANSYFFTQGVQLTEGIEYEISYKYGNNSSDNYAESMQVLYGTSPDAASMVNELADHPEINSGMAATNIVTFTPPASGDYYFGFRAYSEPNQSQLFVDNINISPTLAVPGTENDVLSWYPNPVKDILHLSNSNIINNITVVNLLGQKVLESKPNLTNTTIDFSGLSNGGYIIKITSDGTVRTIKIVKQ
ncbi:T9SS-dependent choice-of-anchor J family protein [Flavobacterium pallidum]|uniref:Fibronectin type-III domain-containing protein n=1 Tax=Flavobacterium pallidum TaxID=2172098 RepID=A0A2S1SK47_9FLAO|nr:choice-of-anchor J domain-containing protein [Flavobacterium pallidum]AWI26794.1 hypothetical protein HYN49_13300 [Flavobacterium pallidum]